MAAPTGVAAFNVQGYTLHSLLCLPTKGVLIQRARRKSFAWITAVIRYLIIDEISMVGKKVFGQVDRCLRQTFPHNSHEVLGSCSCLLFDFGQLPPVMDLLIYTIETCTDLSDQGWSTYLQFDKAYILNQAMCQVGNNPEQIQCRSI